MTARRLRVMVHDAWDTVPLAPAADATVADVKAAALAAARITRAPAEYGVKFRGAELRDEALTLAAAGIPDDANLIVLRRRRRPVR